MPTASYLIRRSEVLDYFDRTAAGTWAKLTSEAPVGWIRATVREGRERMRGLLLDWLPADLAGTRLLDAGCGTGTLALAAAARGAEVVAIDLSPTLVELARERARDEPAASRVEFRVGDMLDPALGGFDHVVAMDSLIHYATPDMVAALATLAARCRRSLLVTYAPRTLPLALMHGVGRIFPRSDRAPSIVPVGEAALSRAIAGAPGLGAWRPARTARVGRGFYTSQALELVPA